MGSIFTTGFGRNDTEGSVTLDMTTSVRVTPVQVRETGRYGVRNEGREEVVLHNSPGLTKILFLHVGSTL